MLLTCGLVAAGCGSKSNSSSTQNGSAAPQSTQNGSAAPQTGTAPAEKTRFAKTKFVLHAGLAFGAFHRYIYKPFKAGAFSGSLLQGKKAKLKGALAALFAYHEIKVALKDAKSSPLLTKLLSPLTSLGNKLKSLGTGLKSGKVDQGAIQSSNTEIGSISSQSKSAGQPITDQPTPSLGG